MKFLLCVVVFWASFCIPIFAASYTVTLPTGITALANPLNNSSNTPNVLFPDADGSRDGDMLYFYNCSGHFDILVFDSASPTAFSDENGNVATMDEIPTLAPGRGFFYNNNTGVSESVNFTGAVATAVFPSPYSCGCGEYSLLGPQNTNASSYQDYTGTAPQNGARVLINIPGKPIDLSVATNFTTYTFADGAWSPGTPPLAICQGAFFYIPCLTPQINVSRANVVLTWPSNAAGMALLSATNLLQTAWITNATAPVIFNGRNTVTNPITGGQHFYRLSQ
jgi:hypothetical protein